MSPHSAADDLAELPAERIATVVGRYWAMDRDARWERTDRALAAITGGEGETADDPVQAVRDSYARDVTDEFIEPVVIAGRPRLETNDEAIFFNFRPDRTRQLSQRLLEGGYPLTTMTRYREDFPFPVAFDEQEVPEVLAEVLAGSGPRAAAHGRDREVRARDVLLQRRAGGAVSGRGPDPRALAARRAELRPEAGDVRAGGDDRAPGGAGAHGVRVRGRQLRQPGHGRAHGRDPGGGAGGRDRRRVPRATSWPPSRRAAGSRWSRPTTATPRSCCRTTERVRTQRTRRTRCPW